MPTPKPAPQNWSRHNGVDVLANNAGGIFGERTVTADGFEYTFQVNHLAPFLLTQLFLDELPAAKINDEALVDQLWERSAEMVSVPTR